VKFDMGRAWNDAVALVSANRHVVPVIAGVFFFLPSFAMALLLPGQMADLQAANGNPAAAWRAMGAFYERIWWAILLVAVVQGIGMLGLLALLTDRSRPTVGEALAIGAKALIPYIVAQFLQALSFVLVFAILVGIGAATGSKGITALLVLVAIVAAAYIFTKFSLTIPVIAIERVMNPVRALARSWRLTKGNSVRLFVFYLLLLIVLMVVAMLLSAIFGLVGVAFGAAGASIVSGVVSALMNMTFVMMLLAVLAAVHRQLSGPSEQNLSETFE